jgi:arabinofuranosyltransferase
MMSVCSGRSQVLGGIVVALSLPLLLWHAATYRFLTDDAFISFRYACNLAHGYGLVFNPGFERVEGYSNFLWVLLLAGFERVGIRPETAAQGLSIAATVGLWGLVAWFGYRLVPRDAPRWLGAVPVVLLAATRSVAVWSTSGLETRLFELLVVAAALRLVVEVESALAARPSRPLAAGLFALATLTRPDGLLIALAALTTAGVCLAARRRLDIRRAAVSAAVFVVLVGGHYAFRRLYYGEWLPNTYYAKVGGRTWWDMGLVYVGMFALEYCIFLWLPLLIASAKDHWDRRALHIPLIFAAIVVPHALYVVAIGGDHFEYRPLDLYFPFAFLLLANGAAHLARTPRRSGATAGYLVLVLVGLTWLPCQSHRQGGTTDAVEAGTFLDPARDPLLRWPILRSLGAAHRALLARASWSLVALRQEDHRAFAADQIAQGERLKRLVASGVLPADTYIAMGAVGAVPYYSGLRVLDRLGLTDAGVVRAGRLRAQRLMAHDVLATFDYARERGVDFWGSDLSRIVVPADSELWPGLVSMSLRYGVATYVADVGEEYYLVGRLPQGLAAARRRFPKLEWQDLRAADFQRELAQRVIAAQQARLVQHPDAERTRLGLAGMLTLTGQPARAVEIFKAVLGRRPVDYRVWAGLASAYFVNGQRDDALQTIEHAIELAEALGNPGRLVPLRNELMNYRAAQWK